MTEKNKLFPVITISREYCAGGRSVAKGLSEKLGIPWYDRDFVRFTAMRSGFSEEDIRADGEDYSETSHFLDTILNNIAAYNSSHDAIYNAQKEAICELAKEPCILVGRCGNMILREAGIKSFDIFLHADKSVRIERAKEIAKNPGNNIEKYVDKRDDLRNNYYKTYTGRHIDCAQDYTICVDTGAVDYETCVDMLGDMIKKLYEI